MPSGSGPWRAFRPSECAIPLSQSASGAGQGVPRMAQREPLGPANLDGKVSLAADGDKEPERAMGVT